MPDRDTHPLPGTAGHTRLDTGHGSAASIPDIPLHELQDRPTNTVNGPRANQPAAADHDDPDLFHSTAPATAAIPQGIYFPPKELGSRSHGGSHARKRAVPPLLGGRTPDLVGLSDTSSTKHSTYRVSASFHHQARNLAAKVLGSAHGYAGYNTARLVYEQHRAHRRKLDQSLTEKLVRNPRRKVLERMRTSKVLKAMLILAEVLVDMTLVVLYTVEMGQSVKDYPEFKKLELEPTWLFQPRAMWLWKTVVALSLFNLLSLVARTYFSESPLRSLFLNPLGIVDMLTIVPAVVSIPLQHGQYLFFPYFLRSIVVIPRLRRLIHIRMEVAEVVIPVDALRERMVVQIASLLCILYVMACSFQHVELVIGNNAYQVVEVLYFSVVSLTTVGYGDIHADTNLSRVVVMIGIAVAFVAIPSLVGSVLDTHRARKAGGGAYHVSHTPHVVLVGRFDRAPFVASIIHAFFTNETAIPVRIVLFSRHSPTADVKNIINAPLYHERIQFIKGSPLMELDLSRVQLRSALAVFVLSSNVASEDERNVLRVWSIAQYAPDVELYVFHHRPEFSRFHIGHATAVVCAEDLRQALLAVASIHPGVATLVTNLVNDAKPLETYASPWLAQYGDGLGHELYNLPVPGVFLGRRFAHVCAYLFREFQVVAIAVRIPVVQAEGDFETIDYHVVLNPGAEYVFCGSEEIVTLAQGIRELELIQKLTPEAFERSLEGESNLFDPSVTMPGSAQLPFLPPSPTPNSVSQSQLDTCDTNALFIGYPTPPPNSVDLRSVPICHLLKDPLECIDAVHLHSDDDPLRIAHLRDHILVITSCWNLFRFLCTLRSAHIPRSDLKPILLLSQSLPTPDEFRALAAFPFVHYMQADPRCPVDLNRARLHLADRVVIMGTPSELGNGTAEGQAEVDDFADLEAILTRHMVTRTAGPAHVQRSVDGGHDGGQPGRGLTVVELNTTSSIKFLAPSFATATVGGGASSLPASGTTTPRSMSVLARSRTQSVPRPISRVRQMSQQLQESYSPGSGGPGGERASGRKPTLPFILSTMPRTQSPTRLSPASPGGTQLSSPTPSSASLVSRSASSGRQSSAPSRVQLAPTPVPSPNSDLSRGQHCPPLPTPRNPRVVRYIEPSATPPPVPLMTAPVLAAASHSSLSLNEVMAEHGYLARRKTRRKRPTAAPASSGQELPTHQGHVQQPHQEQGSKFANRGLRTEGTFGHHIGYPPPTKRAQMFFDPQFASGEAFVAEMLNTILISHFFNPALLDIVRLLSGIRRRRDLELDQSLGLKPSSLYTEPVPLAYAGRPFKDLFIDVCLHRHVVILGLYRAPSTELGNVRPFVYTGPHPDVIVNESDVMYVLRAPGEDIGPSWRQDGGALDSAGQAFAEGAGEEVIAGAVEGHAQSGIQA